MTGFLAASLTWLVELKQNQKKSYNAGRYTSSYHKVGKKLKQSLVMFQCLLPNSNNKIIIIIYNIFFCYKFTDRYYFSSAT